ncbi:hypothetical protein LJB76_02630, partial [Clostridia bacterium OttesenSCG-928-O13]|nr:hypothetical protein [Clostridia bacterium OttesenSCG-928-O13]
MKDKLEKALGSVFVLGVVTAFSSLLFLVFFFHFSRLNTAFVIFTLLAGVGVQAAAYVGARRVPGAKFWPGALMLLSAVATVWAGIAGPAVLYGMPSTFLDDLREGLIYSPMYFVVIPLPLVGLLDGLAWLLLGGVHLARDAGAMAA